MAVKRVLQNPRHYINEKYIDVTLSKVNYLTEKMIKNYSLFICFCLVWYGNPLVGLHSLVVGVGLVGE